jgi:hypothetical protein
MQRMPIELTNANSGLPRDAQVPTTQSYDGHPIKSCQPVRRGVRRIARPRAATRQVGLFVVLAGELGGVSASAICTGRQVSERTRTMRYVRRKPSYT